MKVAAIIQARMGSTRLPGKVLRLLAGRTVLAHVVGRVRAVQGIDCIVVATTGAATDDAVAREAEMTGALVYRGSEHDVLDRYYRAALEHSVGTVVRITSDCPLLDPMVISAMLKEFHSARARGEPYNYMSNGLRRTFPRGLDAEIFTAESLACAALKARAPYEREHVTPYLYEHPDKFRTFSFESDRDFSHHRWTLDTPEDLSMLSLIFNALPSTPPAPTTAQVLEFLNNHPEVALINAGIRQKALKD